jgi:hypothetical protein
MSKITRLVCCMDSKLKLGCLTLVPVKCHKYVGYTIVLPVEFRYDKLTYLRQWYVTPGTLSNIGRNSYSKFGRSYSQHNCPYIYSLDHVRLLLRDSRLD